MPSNAFAGAWTQLNPPLSPWILSAIAAMGFSQMTPVQASTIPLSMKSKDVVVEAVTGSGKTLAFVVPILERLQKRETNLRPNEIGALVISPTRELATQIHSVFSMFSSSAPPESSLARQPLLIISGTESTPAQDIARFLETGADIIVGTPGRIEEFLLGKGSGVVSPKELEVLVFDEADRLLDLGFTAVITKILKQLPKQRRTGLFSATMSDGLSELVRLSLRNPVRVVVNVEVKSRNVVAGTKRKAPDTVEERRMPTGLHSYWVHCKASEKTVQLLRILKREVSVDASSKFIIYFATCAAVDYFYKIFVALPELKDYAVHSLHGHLPPQKRAKALASFSAHPSTPLFPSLLLCTDVASRGLDLPDVDVVVQYDPPVDTTSFSHRAGRTARMGRDGNAWVLLSGNEKAYVDLLSVRKIPMKEVPYLTETDYQPSEEVEDPAVETLLNTMRQIVLQDREYYEKGAKAFVSFVKAYSKHEASYVFRLKDLSLVGVAKSYGLLRLPQMPELKSKRDGWEDALVDWGSYAFTDKAREKRRLAELQPSVQKQKSEKRTEERRQREEKQKKTAPWSERVTVKENKLKRKEKRETKRPSVQTPSHTIDASGDERATKRTKKVQMFNAMSGIGRV